MKTNRLRTLDRDWLMESIQEEEIRLNQRKRKRTRRKKNVYTTKFYVICIIVILAFFSWIAPVMG